jgi:tetratricopeptide (TPR) repeat protein
VSSRSLRALACAAVALATCAVYANVLDAPFLFDDIPSIVENPHVRTLALPDALRAPPGTGANGRPLTAYSLALCHALGALEPFAFRTANVLLHAATALVLFDLVRRTLGRGVGAACAAALLFAVHPLASDALNHVVYRNEVLAALFALATLDLAAVGFAARRKAPAFAGAVAACALAMASKETAAATPLFLLLYDRAFVSGSLRGALRRHAWLYAGLAATWVLSAFLVANADRGTTAGFDVEGATPFAWLLTQTGALVTYGKLAVWPAPLVLDYGEWADWRVPAGLGDVWLEGALVLAFVALALALAWKRPTVGFPLIVALGALAPSSSVFPLTGEVIAEHRAYLPLAALVALAVALVARAEPPRAAAAALVAALALLLGWRTLERNEDYATLVSIWSDTAAKRPRNARAFEHLGHALVAEQRFDEAVRAYRTALEIRPSFAHVHYALAAVLHFQGEEEDARRHFALARQNDPALVKTVAARGALALSSGRTMEGLMHFRGVLELDPRHVGALRALAWTRATHPDPDIRDAAEAVHFGERLAQSTHPPHPRNLDILAAAYAAAGRFDDAIRTAESALALAHEKAELAAQIERRLALYRARRAYVEG